jgi:para-nitrobenzyl esterase
VAAPSAVAELGIRYAHAERFGRPDVLPWTGESLGAFGPPPPQPERPISRFAHGPTPPGVEDCLFLNVWAPPGARSRAVLVWSIGGGWTIGWTGSPVYDGAALAVAADVVVVTFTYRLGSLGWLASPVPNLGLLDHVAALQCVRSHIAAFGGTRSG